MAGGMRVQAVYVLCCLCATYAEPQPGTLSQRSTRVMAPPLPLIRDAKRNKAANSRGMGDPLHQSLVAASAEVQSSPSYGW